MNKQAYNGWTNYETWNVKLWMDNDGYEYYAERAQEIYDASRADSDFTRSERATLTLADSLKDQYENAMQDVLDASKAQTSVWADLLGAALSEVNWHEIANSLMDEVESLEPEKA